MNILVVADEESKSLWDYYEKSKLEDIDLILSCGDLFSFLPLLSGDHVQSTCSVCPWKPRRQI